MKKFAMVTHFTGLSAKENFIYYPFYKLLLKILPYSWLKKYLPLLPAHKIVSIKNITSVAGRTTEGFALMCPFLPEHFSRLAEVVVLKKIVESCKKAKSLGADVVGLAAFTSIVGNEGEVVSNSVDIAVTSGNTYTAVLAIDSIFYAISTLNIDMQKATLVVLGATGDIGSICTKVLAAKFNKVILVARNRDRLVNLIDALSESPLVEIEHDPDVAVGKGDVVLCVASSVLPLVNSRALKSGSIFCDVSVPPAIVKKPENFRKDVLIYDGGKAQVPNADKIISSKWHKLFPRSVIFGCLAETVLLALEEKIFNYSIGRGNISAEKIVEMRNIANKHGFKVAPFFFGEYFYTDDDFVFLREVITKNSNISKLSKDSLVK